MNRQERRRQVKADKAAEKPSPRQEARFREGVGYFEQGEFDAAEERMKEVLAAHPKHSGALHVLGLVEYQTGRIEDAADNLIRAALVDGKDADLHANLAGMLTILGRGAEAEAAARHVISLIPGHWEAYNSLAVALELQGKQDAAEEAALKAIEIRPAYLEGHINLGNLMFRMGRLADAQTWFKKATELDSTSAMAFGNLSVVERQLGNLAEARAAGERAVELDPDYPEGLNSLGNVLASQGELEDARELFERALARRDSYLEAHLNLGAVLYRSGDLAAAKDAYERLLALSENTAEGWSGLARAELALGSLKDAEALFRKAVNLKPSLGDAWAELAAAGALAEEDRATMRSALETPGLDKRSKSQIYNALAHLADGAGDPVEAYQLVSQAQTYRREVLREKGLAFDADAFNTQIDDIIKTQTKDWVSAQQGSGVQSEVPVFVVGMPRSGTTLVERILTAHSKVDSAGELDRLGALVSGDLTAAAAQYLTVLTDGRFADRVVDKTPGNILHVGAIAAILPKAKVIRCVRNADDTLVSCLFTPFADAHPWSTSAEDVRVVQAGYDRLWAHWTDVGAIDLHDVVYEDLVAGVEAQAKTLVEFVGLDWEEACANPHQTAGAVFTASNWQVRKPVGGASVGRAKPYLAMIGG